MTRKDETPRSKEFEAFRKLVKRVVSVPKAEIDKRAKEWKESRTTEKTESEE